MIFDAPDIIITFFIGLTGGIHCIGMCGGISSSLAFSAKPSVSLPGLLVGYHLGRTVSYGVMGALAGSLGAGAIYLSPHSYPILLTLSGILLLFMSLYLAELNNALTKLEASFAGIFALVRPLSKRLLPIRSAWMSLPYGMIWGWLPCGLVYSTLSWSIASGSATQGFLNMFSFGLGTIPVMLGVSLGGQKFSALVKQNMVKYLFAFSLFLYSLYLITKGFSLLLGY